MEPTVLTWADAIEITISSARRIEARRAVVVEKEAGCVCRYNNDGMRLAVSDACRRHRDPALDACEAGPCPGCWTCRGEFWRD